MCVCSEPDIPGIYKILFFLNFLMKAAQPFRSHSAQRWKRNWKQYKKLCYLKKWHN